MKIVTSALLSAACLLLVIAPALSSSGGDVRQNAVELPSLELQVQLQCINISTRFVGDNDTSTSSVCTYFVVER